MPAFLVLIIAFLAHWEQSSPQAAPKLPATRPAATQPTGEASWHRRIPVEWELNKEEREEMDSWRQMLEEEGMGRDEWPRDVEFSDRYWEKRKELTKEEAFAILLRTETVADVAVGYAGETPPQFYALGVLLREPEARGVFLDLNARAGPPGKVYALCALRELDRDAYERGLQGLRDSDVQVGTIQGCIGGTMHLRDVLNDEPGFVNADEAKGEDLHTPFDRRAFLWTRFARDNLK